MALTSYTKTTWVDGTAPAINDTNLNKIETGIYDVTEVAKTNESTLSTLPTTYQPLDTATAKYDESTVWQMNLKGTVFTETYAASVALDMDDSNHFAITLTGNLTLANPINMDDGEVQHGTITLTQDATGGHTLSFGSNWYKSGSGNGGGTSSAFITTADTVNVLRYTVISSSIIIYEFCAAI